MLRPRADHAPSGAAAPMVAERYLRRFPRGRLVALPSTAAAAEVQSTRERIVRRLARRGTLCIALLIAACAEWVQAAFTFVGDDRLTWFHQDFPALYAAGRLVLDGAGDSLYDTGAIGAAELAAAGHPVGGTGLLAYFNPPFFALMLSPLSRLSLSDAYHVWVALNLALLAVACVVVWMLGAPMRRSSRWLLVLGMLTSFPLTYGLQIGQFSIMLLLSWGAAFLFFRRGHPALAGVALAPLLIKPELLVPVAAFLLWKRQWRALATLAPLSAAAVAASLWVIGAHNALRYPAYLADSTTWSGNGIATRVMFDWSGIVAMVRDPSDTRLALVGVALLSLVTLAVFARACRGRLDPGSERFALQWGALTAATILVDPHLYLQDTILVAPAVAALLAVTAEDERGRLGVVLVAGWALLALGIFPNEHLGVNAFGLYMVGVSALLARRLWALPVVHREGAPVTAA